MSKIEWTDKTWNPIVGCSVVSPGCTNCYAMRQAHRLLDKPGSHYEGTTKSVNGNPIWTGKVALAPSHILTAPLKWKAPKRVFVNSMADLFHESIPDEWIDRVFAVMAHTPQHQFQVLTKRSARMQRYVNARTTAVWSKYDTKDALKRMPLPSQPMWPLPNVWLGVSAEDQTRADARLLDLVATPAAVRFVSAEPLLGPINFTRLPHGDESDLDVLRGQINFTPQHIAVRPKPAAKLDWIIVGGESGPGARPMDLAWARLIRDQCKAAGVPFFFKQMAKKAPIPDELFVREFPDASASGRVVGKRGGPQ